MRTVARILRISVPSLLALLAAGAVGTSGALAASPAPSAARRRASQSDEHRQRVPPGLRRRRGRLLPRPAELLGRLLGCGPAAEQRHGGLGLRRHRRLPVLLLDGVVPVRHERRAAVQGVRHGYRARPGFHQSVRPGQPDPGAHPPLLDHLHAGGYASGRHHEHAGGRPERRAPARGRQHPRRVDRLPQLLVAQQRRPR